MIKGDLRAFLGVDGMIKGLSKMDQIHTLIW